MLFHSAEFALFLVIVLIAVLATSKQRTRILILLAASYVFYMWWSAILVLPLLATTFIDYGVARLLDAEVRPERRRGLLILSLTANLGLLAWFKYFDFFAANLHAGLSRLGIETTLTTLGLALPIGISFYTFHTMSYTIDVYRRELPACRSAAEFALFITFFPVLVAGPILRARQFLPQIARGVHLRCTPQIVMLAVRGLAKKVLIADNIAPFADAVFADPRPWPSLVIWAATITFAVQIYCDFSGYSDLARALAGVFGFEIPLNFDRPYFARNPADFWRRWHISLSSWLRDYLYIPLGGSRRGTLLTVRNLLITMLLGGLWHGAGWNFVLWGGMHGMMLALHRLWPARGRMPALVAWLACQYFVLLTWIPFRVRDSEHMLTAMRKFVFFDFDFHLRHLGLSAIFFTGAIVIVATFGALHLWSYRNGDAGERLARLPLAIAAPLLIVIGAAFVLFWPLHRTPFIYFQF